MYLQLHSRVKYILHCINPLIDVHKMKVELIIILMFLSTKYRATCILVQWPDEYSQNFNLDLNLERLQYFLFSFQDEYLYAMVLQAVVNPLGAPDVNPGLRPQDLAQHLQQVLILHYICNCTVSVLIYFQQSSGTYFPHMYM